MLDVNVKENVSNGAADVTTDDQYDAAEFNSIFAESKNLVTQQGGVLTALTSNPYVPSNDDQFMLNKAVIAAGGWIMPSASAGASLAVFTPAAAGIENFPTIAQITGKILTFQMGASPNAGAYTIDYDTTTGINLLNADGSALTSNTLDAFALVQIYYDGVDWILKASGGLSSFFHDGDGGVIWPVDASLDLCEDNRSFQIGSQGMLTSYGDPDFTSLFVVSYGFNFYCEPDIGDSKITSGLFAQALTWNGASGRFVHQYSRASDPDSGFTWRDGWGMNEFGDFFYGEGATVHNTDNTEWLYTWFAKNRVTARNKTGSSNDFFFTGTNIFPTGLEPVLNVINSGPWEFTIEDKLDGKRYYRGSGTALDTFYIGDADTSLLTQFSKDFADLKRLSLNGPVALGALLTGDFLNNEPLMIQHQLGLLSNLQTSKSDFLQDIWGSGFYSDILFGSNAIDYSFAAASTSNDAGRALTFTRKGFVIGIGFNVAVGQASARVAISDPDEVEFEVSITTDEFFPHNVINNQAEDTLFLLDAVVSENNILRSTNDGISWEVVYTNDLVKLGAFSRFPDGIIAIVLLTSDADPQILHTKDNGGNWTLETPTVPDIFYGGSYVPHNENINQGFLQHPDGDFFFVGPAITTEYMTCYKASSISGAWSLVTVVLTGSFGKRGCFFIDQNTGHMFVGTGDASSFGVILRSTNLGVSWSIVYTADTALVGLGSVNKILITPEGVLYALVKMGFTDPLMRVIKSVNKGETWSEVFTTNYDIEDFIYVPEKRAIYTIQDNDVSTGFIINRFPTELEYATAGNSLPTKIRHTDGQIDISIAKNPVGVDDQIDFGVSIMSFARKTMGILKNFGSAIIATEAAIGGFFRNLDDNSYLWVKDLDGVTYPLNNSLQPMLLTAGFLTPDSVNTGALAPSVEIGAGATKGVFDFLDFPNSGTDYYYAVVSPPVNWSSRKIKFRVSWVMQTLITDPGNVGWRLAMRLVAKDSDTATAWTDVLVEENFISPFTANYWRKSVFSQILEIPVFDQNQDDLNFRITRENSVTNNEASDASFSKIEIHWMA